MPRFVVMKRVWVSYTVEAESAEEVEQEAEGTSFTDFDNWQIDGEEFDAAEETKE